MKKILLIFFRAFILIACGMGNPMCSGELQENLTGICTRLSDCWNVPLQQALIKLERL